MRITRKMIRSTAKFFPATYILQGYDHGFEVIRHGENGCSVLFWNDGKAVRTDIPSDFAKPMSIKKAAILLGMT